MILQKKKKKESNIFSIYVLINMLSKSGKLIELSLFGR